jgi:DNA-binding HxlR family transcriptional regulator
MNGLALQIAAIGAQKARAAEQGKRRRCDATGFKTPGVSGIAWSRVELSGWLRAVFKDSEFSCAKAFAAIRRDLRPKVTTASGLRNRLDTMVEEGFLVRRTHVRGKGWPARFALTDKRTDTRTTGRCIIEMIRERAKGQPFTMNQVLGRHDSYTSFQVATQAAIHRGEIERLGRIQRDGAYRTLYQFKDPT